MNNLSDELPPSSYEPIQLSDEPLPPRIDRTGVIRLVRPRLGRNAQCPCGRGKKFKRCCYATFGRFDAPTEVSEVNES